MPFTVIGVLASKGASAGGDQDDTVLIPFRTGQVRLFGATSINQIIVQVADASQMDAATTELTTLLRQHHQLHDQPRTTSPSATTTTSSRGCRA